jgi:hypothetical protein
MDAELERAKKRKKYEGWAAVVKMFRPEIKQSIQYIATELYQADENRKYEQAERMKRGIRQTADVQRILDFGR